MNLAHLMAVALQANCGAKVRNVGDMTSPHHQAKDPTECTTQAVKVCQFKHIVLEGDTDYILGATNNIVDNSGLGPSALTIKILAQPFPKNQPTD